MAVSIVNIAEGSVMGNMPLLTSKSSLRCVSQTETYGYGVQVGDFAGFFVDAYPGRVQAKILALMQVPLNFYFSASGAAKALECPLVNGNGLGRTIVLEIIGGTRRFLFIQIVVQLARQISARSHTRSGASLM